MKLNLKYKKGDLKITNFAALTIAGVINSAGVTLLLAPVNLYDSGMSGLAMFLDALVAVVPLWAWLIILNFPIFLFGLKKQGVAFTVYSLFAIAVYSGCSMIFQNVIPVYYPDFLKGGSPIAGNELILCAIFGGLLSGVGSGMTIRFGGAMDGIEQLAVIFAKKINLTVGNFVMVFNIILYIVIGCVTFAQGSAQYFEIPLYSIVAYAAASKAVDFISQGLDQAKGALIITTGSSYDAVAAALSEEFGRGLTVISAKGYYSNSDKKVIYCVVNRFQVARLRSVVARCDKRAFVTIMDISDVFGTSIKNSRAYDKKRAKQLLEAKLKAEAERISQEQQSESVPENESEQPTRDNIKVEDGEI